MMGLVRRRCQIESLKSREKTSMGGGCSLSTFCPGVAEVGGGWDSQFQVGVDLCRWVLDFVGGGWYPP